jgi:N-acetyl-1-D-myo-inositol-2-amino-2-deoxy-alpha-D-glucopyranoside deacetylase
LTHPAGHGEEASGRTGGLLAVHAHPDDETLSNGALLATWAATGRPVTVVTCTRGERGEVIPPDLRHLQGDGPALARHREQEVAAALAALGVTDHVFLDRVPATDAAGEAAGGTDIGTPSAERRFEDSGMAWAGAGRATAADDVPAAAFVRVPLEDAAARLATVLRARRPAVVVGYEPGGGYGHPDHVRAHEVLHRAVELAGTGPDGRAGAWQVPVVLWTVVEDETWRAALHQLATTCPDGPGDASAPDDPSGTARAASAPGGPSVGRDGLEVPRADAPPSVVRPGPVDVRVPVAPVLGRVLTALVAHRSQVHAVGREPDGGVAVARFALSNDVLQPVLRDETYVVAAGRAQDVDWPVGVTTVGHG